MAPIQLTIIGKPACHLCDDADAVIAAVLGELKNPASVVLEKLSILDDPVLNERYWSEIPVVLIDGVLHSIWRVDPALLRAALVA